MPFVALFSRLQGTLAAYLLPAALHWLAEPTGTTIDNTAWPCALRGVARAC
jgi:hypothetical protein